MSRSVRPLKFVALIAGLFAAGIFLGLGYQWYRGLIVPSQFFLTAAGSATPSEIEAWASATPSPYNPLASMAAPSPQSNPPLTSNVPPIQPAQPVPSPNSNVTVLNSAKPPPISSPARGDELTLPQSHPQESADRLPAIGSGGQTIWVPRAIEGCWAGTGGSSLEYLGGCPDMFSGSSTPIKLRWCFRRMGDQPLTLMMAKGQYPGRVSQRWDVVGAHGQTIELREKISYMTMMFLRVVDVGDWSCRITPGDELVCDEHEMARCGPGGWINGPWFRGNGSVTARRVGGGTSRRHVASEP
jgi:hypothetical protein